MSLKEQKRVTFEKPLEAIDPRNRKRTAAIRVLWSDPKRRKEMIDKIRSRNIGRVVSKETKKAIAAAQRGKVRSRESRALVSLAKGGIRVTAGGLVKRFVGVATNSELAKMAEVTERQIIDLKNDMKRGNHPELNPVTKEEESYIKKRSYHSRSPRGQNGEYSADQLRDFLFVQKLRSKGLVLDNTQGLKKLRDFYNACKRDLPESPAQQLRLEIYYDAIQRKKAGDKKLLSTYNRLGRSVDEFWFGTTLRREEQFIREYMPNELGYAEDELGFFRVVDGHKFRPIVEFGNSKERRGINFDKSNDMAEREANRRRVTK